MRLTLSADSVCHTICSKGTHDAHFAHALVDFAYRLLNQPESLRPEDGPGERMIIESLLHNTVLCRMRPVSHT